MAKTNVVAGNYWSIFNPILDDNPKWETGSINKALKSIEKAKSEYKRQSLWTLTKNTGECKESPG